jgi:hypothetical protein
MSTGNFFIENNILSYLYALGGYWNVDAAQCLRLGCRTTTGLYWCNDNAWALHSSGLGMYWEAQRIMGGCCRSSASKEPSYALAGQAGFPDDHADAAYSRVVLGYADCHDPLDVQPLKYAADQSRACLV